MYLYVKVSAIGGRTKRGKIEGPRDLLNIPSFNIMNGIE